MGNDSRRVPGSSPDGSNGHVRQQGPGVPDVVLTAFAHELRNALGPVRTAAYLLRASATHDAQAQWALDLIDRQVQSITASIDELADFARLTRGTLELRFEPIDYRDVLDGAASACVATLAEKRHTLEWKPPAAPVQLRGDCARLTQVVTAVLRSAARAAAAGSRIRVRVDRSAAEVTTTVGILARRSPTEPLAAQRDGHPPASDEAAEAPKSVGWTLAQAIVARHGGALVALDPSRFTIRLPLAAERE